MTTNPDEVTQSEINNFESEIAKAAAIGPVDEPMAWVEAPLKMLKHYNQGRLHSIDGSFIYKSVRVYEAGRRAEVHQREGITIDQRNHGKSAII